LLPVIDEILDALKNGQWHDLKEILERTHLSRFKFEILTNFLAEYNFIELDKKKQRTRLTPPLMKFIKKIGMVDEKQESSTFLP